MVPAGVNKRVKCKCGMYFYQILIGATGKLSDACSICKPQQYVKQEDKK